MIMDTLPKSKKRSRFATWLIAKIGAWLTYDQPPQRSYLSDFDSICAEIRPGDVLLIEGRNHVSSIIRRITQSPWTHAALYIGRLKDVKDPSLYKKIRRFHHFEPTTQLLIESMLGQGTIVSPIDKYKEDHIRICRPQGLSDSDAQRVISYAGTHLGRRYSIRHILDLARFLLPWSLMPRRWKSTLFAHSADKPTEDICSSMIAEAFTSINFPILPLITTDKNKGLQLFHRNPKLFTPSDFDYSPFFNIIKYPIFNISKHTSYHSLPWGEANIISNDEFGLETLEPLSKNEIEAREHPHTHTHTHTHGKKH